MVYRFKGRGSARKTAALLSRHSAVFELPFRTFTHFGTSQAANDRIGTDQYEWSPDSPKLFPVFLKIIKPFRYTDFKNNGYGDVLRTMLKKGVATHEEIESLRDSGSQGWRDGGFFEEKCGTFIMKRLTERGFDGLSYMNKYEDIGSMSWVVLDADQVWPEFRS